jgi:SAM-dependent methyltransferase
MNQVKYSGSAPQSNFEETARYNVSLLGEGPKGSLLDIGAYKGMTRKWLPHSVEYQGIDVQDWGMDCIKEVNLNASGIPFPDASFDYIIAANVIEHLLIPPQQMVKEIHRVAKPGALCVISLPNDRGLAVMLACVLRMFKGVEDLAKQEFGHHWQFDLQTARSLLLPHFEIVDTRYHAGVYLKMLPILNRIKVLTSDLYFICRKTA